jgi:two-component system, NtrC family, response regulator HydG
MTHAILLVDRDVAVLREIGGRLEQERWEVARELDGAAALVAAGRLDPDVVVLDLGMPPANGEPLLGRLTGMGLPVIAVLDRTDPAATAEAFRAGAALVLTRPLDPAVVAAAAGPIARSARWRRYLARPADPRPTAERIARLGGHPPMRAVGHEVTSIAHSDRAAVLLVGEPGVGKGHVARLIHDHGPRAGEPFLAVAPGRVAELESALFGREADARSDRGRRVRGALEAAGGGTVLLREVGAVPVELQPALLRLLEHRTLRRRGGDRDVPVGARLVATTTQDLAQEVEAGRFHGDLHYRLATLVLAIPPVRERAESDRRALLADVYADVGARWSGAAPVLAEEAVDRLLAYAWPGNVGEMRHVLERAALLARGQPAVLVEHLAGELRARPGLGDRRHQPMSLEDVERRQIESSLRYHGGNRTRAAKELRISRATLINKIKRYSLTD